MKVHTVVTRPSVAPGNIIAVDHIMPAYLREKAETAQLERYRAM